MLTKDTLDLLESKLICTQYYIYCRIKQAISGKMMVSFMTKRNIEKIEVAQEVTEDLESRFVVYIHIGVTSDEYGTIRNILEQVFKKLSQFSQLFCKLCFFS